MSGCPRVILGHQKRAPDLINVNAYPLNMLVKIINCLCKHKIFFLSEICCKKKKNGFGVAHVQGAISESSATITLLWYHY